MLLRRCCLPIAFYFAAWLTLTLSQAFCFVQSTERFLGTSPRMITGLFPHTLLFFFLLVAFLMQHLQHSVRLPWGPVQGRSLPSGAHFCSTTVPFPSFTMDFYFTYCLFPYCTLKREMLATKIKYPKIPCGTHPLVSFSEVCLTPHRRDLGAMLPRSLANVQNKVWSIQCNPCIFQCWKFSL